MTTTAEAPMAIERALKGLFEPIRIGSATLPNRIVMPAMGRCLAKDGVLADGYIDYYRRRAEGGAGLVTGEATAICPGANSVIDAPHFYGDAAIAQWARVAEAVHSAGGCFMPQLWHAGLARPAGMVPHPEIVSMGPSGWYIPNVDAELKRRPGRAWGDTMTQAQIDGVVDAYATAAAAARAVGCDGIELHGAHGYLIDQFFWADTNRRDDAYGKDRTRFAVEVIRAVRERTAPDFPILFRFSQWKVQDYFARVFDTPQDLEALLTPLVEAGVDMLHCSTRRFWEPAFAGSDLSLAAWTKKLSGIPVIAVGSVGTEKALAVDSDGTFNEYLKELESSGRTAEKTGGAGIGRLLEAYDRGDFDMIAVGRSMIANPDWGRLVRDGAFDRLLGYDERMLLDLE